MRHGITRGEQNLLLLESMIPSNERLYVWCYDAAGDFLSTSCPDEIRQPLDEAFRNLNAMQKALQYAAQADGDKPLIIGSSIGLRWAVVFESERNRELLFVVGPVTYAQPNLKQIRDSLYGQGAALERFGWIDGFLEVLGRVAVMSIAVFSRYVVMIHNTLTGQQLGLEDLSSGQVASGEIAENAAGSRDRIGVYRAEKAMLQMVRDGNIHYQSAFQCSSQLSPGVPVTGREPLRQEKISIIVFTTLVSRAAMEGGLSPEVAYSLGDSYIQAAENSRDAGELSALAQAMYHDFIYRVHHVRANPNYSHAIQKCCDYIELSLDRRIRTVDLASLVGYTEYYLTEKFKKETGKTVSSYIREAKVARARLLLESTNLSVAEISDRLAFNTPNYFIQCFKSIMGETPSQFRKECKG